MNEFDIVLIGKKTRQTQFALSRFEAASQMNISLNELNWAIEECGRCESNEFLAVHVDPELGEDDEL